MLGTFPSIPMNFPIGIISKNVIILFPDNNNENSYHVDDAKVPKNTNKNIHVQNRVFQTRCLICQFEAGKVRLVSHYVNSHPNLEVYISRLAPEVAEACRLGVNKRRKADFMSNCLFCDKMVSNKMPTWISHIATHTGEYVFQCSGCKYKRTYPKKHACSVEGAQPIYSAIPVVTKFQSCLYAFICKLCNYVQMTKSNVEAHIEKQHDMKADSSLSIQRISLFENWSDYTMLRSYDVDDKKVALNLTQNSNEDAEVEKPMATVQTSAAISNHQNSNIKSQTGVKESIFASVSNAAKNVVRELDNSHQHVALPVPEKERPIVQQASATASNQQDSHIDSQAEAKESILASTSKAIKDASHNYSNSQKRVSFLMPREEELITTTSSQLNTSQAGAKEKISGAVNGAEIQIPSEHISARRANLLNPSPSSSSSGSSDDSDGDEKRVDLKPWIERSRNEKKKEQDDVVCMLSDEVLVALYKCMAINCTFSTEKETEMLQHLSHHGRNKDSRIIGNRKRDYLQCAYCSITATSAADLVGHIQMAHYASSFQCRYCFYRSVDAYSTLLHMKKYHHERERVILMCDGFDEKTIFYQRVEAHIKRRNLKVISSTDFYCLFCSCYGSTIDKISIHMADKHPDKLLFVGTGRYGSAPKITILNVAKRIDASVAVRQLKVANPSRDKLETYTQRKSILNENFVVLEEYKKGFYSTWNDLANNN